MNKTRRLLTLLLALCMVAGMVPFAAFSATPEELANRKNSGSSTLVDTTINAVSDYVATAAVEKGTKPADGTTTGNPFPKGTAGSTSFRIPALVTLSNGSLVAAVDARWNTNFDGGGLDTIVSRSSDNGANWKYTFANYLGDNGNQYNGKSSCFIDPALAVTVNDTVYMLVDLYPYGVALNGSGHTQPSKEVGFYDDNKLKLTKNSTAYYLDLTNYTIYPEAGGNPVSGYSVDAWFNITGTDGTKTNLFFEDSPFQVVRTGYLYLTTSTDGGATWSAPKLLNLKTSSEMVCLVGPGRGLVTKSGMIVFPVYSYNGSSASQRTSFIYSTDGGVTWGRSANFDGASWSSESAVVELDSNTLRFFYRNGTTQLCYTDYTLSNGNVAGGSWGGAVSTGIATNSDTQISAITYSKTIGGKQVILVSCPAGPNDAGAASSNASNRVNGKIFVFTVESNKSLARKGTIDVPSRHNTTSNNFLYSCLTELSNGKVGILFEDNVSDNTNPQFCELSYVTYDIAQKLNLQFDTPTNNTLSDTQQGVTVTFGATDVTGWTMTVIPNQTVSALGSAKYSAFDVTITDNKGNSYTGAAEVKLPLGNLASAVGLYPFVVGADGIEKITPYSISDGYITFTAPHFSVMGVAVDPDLITNTVDVTLKVGEQQEFTDETGNYADAVTNVSPDGNIATMTVTGTGTGSAAVTPLTELVKGDANTNTFYIQVEEGVYLTADCGTTKNLNEAELWYVSRIYSGYCYTKSTSNTANYLTAKNGSFNVSTSVMFVYLSEGRDFLSGSGGTVIGTPVVAGGATAAETEITFTGMSAGTATAVVGTTQYNITVNNRDKVENVTLKVGQTKTYTDDTGNYENDPNTIAPSAGVATMTVTGIGSDNVTVEALSAIGLGDEFYIQVSEGEYLKSDYTTTTNLNEAQKWYASEAYSYYCVIRSELNGGVYLGDSYNDYTVRTSQSKVFLKMTDGKLVGYYSNQPAGTPVQVTGDLNVKTEISFTGVAEGKTTAVVGDTQYNITVIGYETRDILLFVGNSYTDVIEGMAYTDADITVQPNTGIATVDSVANGKLTGVTSLDQLTDGQYLIVNSATGTVLTNTAADIYGDWGLKNGLAVSTEDPTQSQELWTVTAQNGSYLLSQDGQYMTIGGYHAEMTGEAAELTLEYLAGSGWTIGGKYAEHGADTFYLHDGVGDGYENGALGSSNLSDKGYWRIYKITGDAVETSTEVTFTGVKKGTTTAKIGAITYNITVLDVPEMVSLETTPFIADVNQDVSGQSELVKPVTKLTTSVGTRYNVDLDITGTDIRWTTLDPNVATVDEYGVVTGTGLGETTLICYVDGKAYAMPISVTKDPETSSKRLFSLYIDDVINTTVYYSWHADGNLVEAKAGEVIRVESDTSHACGISFFGAPDDGYALTYMSATNSAGQYLALQDKEDPTKCDYYTKNGAGTNMIRMYGDDAVAQDIAAATKLGCDGAQGFTREQGKSDVASSQLTFISEKLVGVQKEIEGVLATTNLQADYRHYYENMVAGAGEMLYYKITVTLERPETWIVENGVETNKSSLVYSNAILEETMPGAYFYTKEQDLLDGKWSGDLPENLRTNTIDITADLNKAWADDEEVRELTYYVVYKITADDIPKFELKNHLNFKYDYNAVFSSAKEITATTAAHALISVVSEPMKDIVIDTPQPITLTGLDNKHLKFAFCDEDQATQTEPLYTAKHGTVSVSKEIVYKQNDDGTWVPDRDKDGYILYNYELTYTPDPSKGILTEPDAILIYGMVPDVNDNNILKRKIVNGFNIFPATTVYYEENYIKWNGWTAEGTSMLPTEDTENDAWYVDFVGDAEKRHNYGYDPIYEGSNAASGGTYVATSTQGASGTFDFTGTGFEIYANCTEETGYVMVLVKSNTTGQIRLYTVNTKVDAGSSAATSQQSGTYYSVPIVSVHDLAHDSYNVRIVKSTDYDEFGVPMTASKPVQIDGVRIVQTMDPATSEDYFSVDSEKGPSFVELRDLVLTGVDVEANVTNGEYPTTDQIISQVYSDTGSLNAVVWINSNPGYTNLQDLLENGPKNELYLWPGQAVTFKLNSGVTAQIGMKTVSGSSVTYTYNGASHTINSSTDMFYHNPSAEEVTITNNSGGVLSITLLKYWGASTETLLAEVSESQIAYALLSLRELPAKDAVLHVTAVDYTGEQIGSVRLAKPGAEGEYVVFTREELLAQLPEGYMPLDEVTDIRVTCGEERTVSARIGKVATLKVEYVRLYKHGEVDMGGTRVPVMGKKTVTETLTKVQASDGNAVFTAQEIWAAAPAGAVLHGLSDIQVAYGQTENISVFDTQLANSQVVPSIKL